MTSGWPVEHLAASPDGVDLDRPSAARVYDYELGGSHNYAVDREHNYAVDREHNCAVDRETACQIVRLVPNVPRVARADRAFLRPVVEGPESAGVRVAYVDIGPISVGHKPWTT